MWFTLRQSLHPKFEEMKESHLLQVAEIENKCFSHPWSLKSLESELKNNGSHFYVSVEDDKVLGYIGMNVVVDEGYIFNVAVDENARKIVIKNQENKKVSRAKMKVLVTK